VGNDTTVNNQELLISTARKSQDGGVHSSAVRALLFSDLSERPKSTAPQFCEAEQGLRQRVVFEAAYRLAIPRTGLIGVEAFALFDRGDVKHVANELMLARDEGAALGVGDADRPRVSAQVIG